MRDERQARSALALLDYLNSTGAKSVLFDVTANGLGRSRSPLKLAFDAPLSVAAQKILDVLDIAYAPMSKTELIKAARIDESGWEAAIQALRSRDRIEQHGKGRGVRYSLKRREDVSRGTTLSSNGVARHDQGRTSPRSNGWQSKSCRRNRARGAIIPT